MRRFVAGAAIGLVAGLVLGIGAAGLLGIGADEPTLVTRSVQRDAALPTPRTRPDAPPREPGTDTLPSDGAGERHHPRRGRVERPEPVKRDLPKNSEKSADEKAPVSTAQLLRDLRALLEPGTVLGGAASDVAVELVARDDAPEIPLDWILAALAKADSYDDEGRQVAGALAQALPETVAYDALRRAMSGDEKLQWIADQLASALSENDEINFAELSVELMGNPSMHVRDAGVWMTNWTDTPPIDTLIRVAQSDPIDSTRAWAMDTLTGIADDLDDPAVAERIRPIVLLSALEGSVETRREAIHMFEEMGPPAAATAMQLLREGGLDEELAYYVVRPPLQAGLIDKVMETQLSQHVVGAVIWWAEEGEEGEELNARVAPLAPHAERLFALADRDAAESLASLFIQVGRADVVEAAALSPDARDDRRHLFLERLFTSGLAPEDRQADLDRRALRVLRSYLDPETRGVDERRRTAAAGAWGDIEFDSSTTLAAAIGVLENTARSDPNSWVRGAAEESLVDLREALEDWEWDWDE